MTEAQRNIARKALVEWLATHPDDLKIYEEDIDYVPKETRKWRKWVWLVAAGLTAMVMLTDYIDEGVVKLSAIMLLPVFIILYEVWILIVVKFDARSSAEKVREAKERMNQ